MLSIKKKDKHKSIEMPFTSKFGKLKLEMVHIIKQYLYLGKYEQLDRNNTVYY